MANGVKHLLEFGPYRVDAEHRLLLRGHDAVPLSPKAFDLLLVLLERSGEVVSKDDLMKLLWPDTFVEESNLGQQVFQLRKALGERPQDHAYIITVPGRGYQFVEQVRAVSPELANIAQDEKREHRDEDGKQQDIVIASRSLAQVVIEGQRKKSLRFWMISVALVGAVAIIAGSYRSSESKPKLTEKDTIVLGDFDNRTGDPVFDVALRQALSAQLVQSPFLNLLSDSRTANTLALMGRARDAHLTGELTREVCQRTQSTAALDGSITQIGTHYLLTLKAVACINGELLASTDAQANDKNHVLDALGKMASTIRPRLGESLGSVEKYDVPVPEVTTGSLEALRAYALARKALFANRPNDAISLYKRAISLDPNFASPYEGLGVVYFNADETTLAAENMKKAYDLRGHVSEHEKLFIEMAYEMAVTRNFEAASKSGLAYTQIYPREFSGYTNLGAAYGYLGDYEKGFAATQKALELNPSVSQNYTNAIFGYLHFNRVAEAEAVAADARKQNFDSPFLHECLYLADFLKHDTAAMDREASEVMGRSDSDLMFYYESDTAAYGGQFAKARERMQKAVNMDLRAGQKETAAEYKAEAAVTEALAGNLTLAKHQAHEALPLSPGRGALAISAIALGLTGDSEAGRLAEDLRKRFPEDTALNYNLLPSVRAAIALSNGDAAKAIDALSISSPYELGVTAQEADFVLYSVYLRGLAYLAAKQGPAATSEFQKIIDHPGLVVNEPIGALAHLGLGRAYVLSHDVTKAKTEYQSFLSLWKEADADIPILKQAKTEYAKLQ
jgi:eukaryotic-like serine/threonine-protein kinase